MLSRKNKLFFIKLLSLFSVVRGYNIWIIVFAQYLTSIFILAPKLSIREVIFDIDLFVIIFASSIVVAAGYIINSFYDSEKDLINRPQKTMLDRLVSQQTKLTGYFLLNFIAVIFASYVSFKAVVFFSLYIFAIWFYSHKLKKIPFIANVTAASLAIAPFFAIFVYYKNFEKVIFVHAIFLFLILTMREMVKDLENIKGDMANNYKTIPVVYGEQMSKRLLIALILITIVPLYLLLYCYEIGYMKFYFYIMPLFLAVFAIIIYQTRKHIHYLWLHNILKLIIVAGVFSIILIDIERIILKILDAI